MFGIGGGELFFILLIILMLFGSDKVPEMARTFGKFMAQVKNATNDIKHEITKNVEQSGITDEIKETFDVDINPVKDIQEEVDKQKQAFEDITGPIKRLP